MRTPTFRMQRTAEGLYRVWWVMENRCCVVKQVGALQICVMNDYGFLVTVSSERVEWS